MPEYRRVGYRTLAEPDTQYSCGTSSASGIRVTEGGGGLGGRAGVFSVFFIHCRRVVRTVFGAVGLFNKLQI